MVRAAEELEGSVCDCGAVVGGEEAVGRERGGELPCVAVEGEESGEERGAANGEASVGFRAGVPAGQEVELEGIALGVGGGDLGRGLRHAVGGEDGPAEGLGGGGEGWWEGTAADEEAAEGCGGVDSSAYEVVELGGDEGSESDVVGSDE